MRGGGSGPEGAGRGRAEGGDDAGAAGGDEEAVLHEGVVLEPAAGHGDALHDRAEPEAQRQPGQPGDLRRIRVEQPPAAAARQRVVVGRTI